MVAEIRSFIVVIKGPEATAGSIFIFLNKRGISVPPSAEMNIASARETPMQPAYESATKNASFFKKRMYSVHIIVAKTPKIKPFTSPTRASLNIRCCWK